MKPSQSKPAGNFQFRNAQQQAPKPNAPPRNVGDRRCFNCGQPGHYISECPKHRQSKPNAQNQGAGNKPPMVQVRQDKLNFTAMSDIPEGASVLTGTFSINDTPIKILLSPFVFEPRICFGKVFRICFVFAPGVRFSRDSARATARFMRVH
jgi:hypothetical protein